MMHCVKVFILLLAFPICFAKGQNIVRNPGFEIITSCPDAISQIGLASDWSNPNNGTPDLYHECDTSLIVGVPQNTFSTNLPAHQGKAYAGIHMVYRDNYREYLQVELEECLRKDVEYEIQFYVALSDLRNNPFLINLLHVGFLSEAQFFQSRSNLSIIPDIRFQSPTQISQPNEWELVKSTYKAKGGERFMLVGNFFPNDSVSNYSFSNGSYLFFDDFQLVAKHPFIATKCQNSICKGEPFTMEVNGGAGQFNWKKDSRNGQWIGTGDKIQVFPSESTWYFLIRDQEVMDSFYLNVYDIPDVRIVMDCSSEPIKVGLNGKLNEIGKIKWSNGNSKPELQEFNKGEHWVYLEGLEGCGDTIPFRTDVCWEFFVCPFDTFSFSHSGKGDWFSDREGQSQVSIGPKLELIDPQSGDFYFFFQGTLLDSLRLTRLEEHEIELSLICYETHGVVQILNPLEKVWWSDGEEDAIQKEVNFGEHWVKTRSEFGCIFNRDFSLLNDCQKFILCPGDSLFLEDWGIQSLGIYSEALGDFFDLEGRESVSPLESDTWWIYEGRVLKYKVELLVKPVYVPILDYQCKEGLTEVSLTNPIGEVQWSNGDSGSGPILMDEQGEHWVEVYRYDGCVFRNDLVFERDCQKINSGTPNFLPNSISPNGDGINDYFEIIGELKGKELRIFDRWGREVYYSQDYQEDWNAEGAPTGIYYYELFSYDLDKSWRGWIQVIR